MKYNIIADSSCDLRAADFNSDKFEFTTIPITVTIEGKDYYDDESLNIGEMISAMKLSKKAPMTSCPSPDAFANAMKKDGDVICVTLSSKLSGTFNSARLAAEQVREEKPNKNIFILDSLMTSAGMALILIELKRMIENEVYDFETIVKHITEYAKSVKIRFIVQDLSNFIKTGRMKSVTAMIASMLSIKPICGDNGDGEIKVYEKVLGTKKALKALSRYPAEKVAAKGENTPIIITHCYNEPDVEFLKLQLEAELGLTNITIYAMRGVASVYANEKGLSIAF